MRIIPAIDLIDGAAVRLEKGDFEKKTIYNSDPVTQAKIFEDAGMKHLHLVDLDGAKAGKVINIPILEKIAASTDLTIDFGGGVRTQKDIESVLNAGANQVNIGSLSVKDPDTVVNWIGKYGTKKIILSPDVKGRFIATHGWQETSEMEINAFISSYSDNGGKYFVCTDIDRDGMLSGSSLELYKDILSEFPDIHLIASGGVANIEEMELLKNIGIEGVIIGKAIYEGRIDLKELRAYVD